MRLITEVITEEKSVRTNISLILSILILITFFIISLFLKTPLVSKSRIAIDPNFTLIYLLTKTFPISNINYNLILTSNHTTLESKFIFDQNLSEIIIFNISEGFYLQNIQLNDKNISPAYISKSQNSLLLDTSQLILKNQILKLTLDSLQTPKHLIIQLPIDQVLSSHILNINYPTNDLITVDKNPAFAKPGLLQYNLPTTGAFQLQITYGQTPP